MKMCVSKKMWNWKDVLAKRGDIANVCYLKGSVIRKGVLFKKMCYKKDVLSKRYVILLKACYRKMCVIDQKCIKLHTLCFKKVSYPKVCKPKVC